MLSMPASNQLGMTLPIPHHRSTHFLLLQCLIVSTGNFLRLWLLILYNARRWILIELWLMSIHLWWLLLAIHKWLLTAHLWRLAIHLLRNINALNVHLGLLLLLLGQVLALSEMMLLTLLYRVELRSNAVTLLHWLLLLLILGRCHLLRWHHCLKVLVWGGRLAQVCGLEHVVIYGSLVVIHFQI